MFIPVKIGNGNQFDINITVHSAWGSGANWYGYGGFGTVGYAVQVHDGSPGAWTVPLTSGPEPAGQAVLGLLLVAGLGFWRKHRPQRSRPIERYPIWA